MSFYITVLTIVTLVIVSSAQIKPLFAGTLILDDDILRRNICIFKNIPLPLTKTEFQSNKNINVVGAISSMSMDHNFVFQFRYQILCPTSQCLIDFVLSRYTEVVSQNFQYLMAIDFLVAENLITDSLNMTFYKTDLNMNYLKTQNQAKDLKEEGEDEWEVILIPNGFNNISKTGHTTQSYQPQVNKLIIAYQDSKDENGVSDFMGWPLNHHFILFKPIFIPKSYFTKKNCESTSMFEGFLSTPQASINFNVHQESSQNYNKFSLPISCSGTFKDNRIFIEKINQSNGPKSNHMIQVKYIFVIIPFLIAELAYIFYKKRTANKNSKKMKLPDLLISFDNTQIVSENQMKKTQKCQTNSNIQEQQMNDAPQ